jgi:hypothetical protein
VLATGIKSPLVQSVRVPHLEEHSAVWVVWKCAG